MPTFIVTVTYEVEAADQKEAFRRIAKYDTDIIYHTVQNWAKDKGQKTEVRVTDADCKIKP